jgi:thioester reductase-like protein
MKGIVNPEQLDLNQDFRNSYEQSKALAESSVRTLEGSVPYFIYRPSIIVGDSITGKTSTFNVLYVPARFIAKGLFRALPALPNIPFDVVPVDYVADAIDLLSRPGNQLGKHRCFHLCAGVGRESSPKEILLILIETINKYYQRTRGLLHMPSLVSPELLSRAFSTLSAAKNSMMHLEELVTHHIPVLRKTLPFIPYMVSNPRFEMKRTCSALHNLLEPAPLFNSYAETIFRYCLDTNWGKNSPILAPQG